MRFEQRVTIMFLVCCGVGFFLAATALAVVLGGAGFIVLTNGLPASSSPFAGSFWEVLICVALFAASLVCLGLGIGFPHTVIRGELKSTRERFAEENRLDY